MTWNFCHCEWIHCSRFLECLCLYLHLDSLHLYSPGVSAIIQNTLQDKTQVRTQKVAPDGWRFGKYVLRRATHKIWETRRFPPFVSRTKDRLQPTKPHYLWIRWPTCIKWETLSRSARISLNVLVPRMFLSVVCDSSRVDRDASSTLVTDIMGLLMR